MMPSPSKSPPVATADPIESSPRIQSIGGSKGREIRGSPAASPAAKTTAKHTGTASRRTALSMALVFIRVEGFRELGCGNPARATIPARGR